MTMVSKRRLAGGRGPLAGLVCALSAALLIGAIVSSASASILPTSPPNFVVIVIDDAGFSDLSAYGGEAHMPNINRLAAEGVRFSNYHTSPLCAPSRAMILTGIDNHKAGVATIPEVLPAEQEGKPGYSLRLEPGVVTVAERLRSAGYKTYMTGKWHLGHEEGDLPNHHGFDRSFALDASGADNWDEKPYMPYYTSADWFEDGKRAHLPEDFYSSTFIAEKLIDYLKADESAASPFFAYVSFQAVHIPVQAPRAYTDNYEGLYEVGWEAIQKQRFDKAKSLGLVPEGAALPTFHPTMRAWDSLSAEEQRLSARSMAVHAGMLEAMDAEIGKIIAYLEERGELANTYFLITSDNGPEPSVPVGDSTMSLWMRLNGYTFDYETLGERGSLNFIGREWASATAVPGRLFKFYTSEGGLRVPLIIAGPSILPRVPIGVEDAFAFATDLAPTILDLAGAPAAPAPDEMAMSGRSLRPLLHGVASEVYGASDPVGVEVAGNIALYKGSLKLMRNAPPYGTGEWELFDIAQDPGETRNLAEAMPDTVRELEADYRAYAAANGVLDMPPGYDVHEQIKKNLVAKQIAANWWVLALAAGVILGIAALLIRLLMSLMRRA